MGRFYQSLSEYWVLPPLLKWEPNECFQLPASPVHYPTLVLPHHLLPEGTTLCPQLTTQESAWLCVYLSKKWTEEGFGKLKSGLLTRSLRILRWQPLRTSDSPKPPHVGVKAPVKNYTNFQ